MKVLSVVGARPQFIKVAPVARAMTPRHQHLVAHTGQHYDANMSAVFFEDLSLPRPDFDLAIGSGRHGAQTGAMLATLEQIMIATQPDWVLVYGDTNSTVAGALAAAKLQIRLAHIEAGLRSFNRRMPEEINRVVADHVADLLLCPSDEAVRHLAAEGVTEGVHCVGDVMADALPALAARARERSTVLKRLAVAPKQFVLATIHRAENTDDPSRLLAIVEALNGLGENVVLPIHPRTRRALTAASAAFAPNVIAIEPVGYLDMLALAQHARVIVTDSGGLQKEAYWLGVPCVTVREETEWVETVAAGWNVLTGADRDRIVAAARRSSPPLTRPSLYGDGRASQQIVALLEMAQ